jgi:hypothetical protein
LRWRANWDETSDPQATISRAEKEQRGMAATGGEARQ